MQILHQANLILNVCVFNMADIDKDNVFRSKRLHSQNSSLTKYFTDVTLVSDDMECIDGHRIILSDASNVLNDLFMLNPSSNNLMVFMKGIKHHVLDSLMKFIYTGEVAVRGEHVEDFLKGGKELQILEIEHNEDQVQSVLDTPKIKVLDELNSVQSKKTIFYDREASDDGSIGKKETDAKPNKHRGFKSSRAPECGDCQVSFKSTYSFKRHIQSIHEGRRFACHICTIELTSEFSLTRHLKTLHSHST